jgi:2-oxo-4-hydroxy-4-carboxy-5-ureidoimidazoline decarboxylase
VRGSSRGQILDAFAARLENDYDLEFETALAEIHKIARLRLDAMGAIE